MNPRSDEDIVRYIDATLNKVKILLDNAISNDDLLCAYINKLHSEGQEVTIQFNLQLTMLAGAFEKQFSKFDSKNVDSMFTEKDRAFLKSIEDAIRKDE